MARLSRSAGEQAARAVPPAGVRLTSADTEPRGPVALLPCSHDLPHDRRGRAMQPPPTGRRGSGSTTAARAVQMLGVASASATVAQLMLFVPGPGSWHAWRSRAPAGIVHDRVVGEPGRTRHAAPAKPGRARYARSGAATSAPLPWAETTHLDAPCLEIVRPVGRSPSLSVLLDAPAGRSSSARDRRQSAPRSPGRRRPACAEREAQPSAPRQPSRNPGTSGAPAAADSSRIACTFPQRFGRRTVVARRQD